MQNPIKTIRERSKMSLADLANAVGLTKSAVQNAERTDPRLSTICKYATAAGVRTITIDMTKDWPDDIDVRMKRGGG